MLVKITTETYCGYATHSINLQSQSVDGDWVQYAWWPTLNTRYATKYHNRHCHEYCETVMLHLVAISLRHIDASRTFLCSCYSKAED